MTACVQHGRYPMPLCLFVSRTTSDALSTLTHFDPRPLCLAASDLILLVILSHTYSLRLCITILHKHLTPPVPATPLRSERSAALGSGQPVDSISIPLATVHFRHPFCVSVCACNTSGARERGSSRRVIDTAKRAALQLSPEEYTT